MQTTHEEAPLYQHRKFVKHMEGWVDSINDPMLNRAWEICLACINAHAIVDRDEDETIKQARASAWADLADGFQGKDMTGTYRGIIGELYDSVPEGLENDLERVVLEAHHLALGQLTREAQAALQARDEFPQLKLVWNQDHEKMEH